MTPIYAHATRAEVCKSISPSSQESLSKIAWETVISRGTLYNLRRALQQEGKIAADYGKHSEQWVAAHSKDFLMRLGDSADRTYANYGHELDVTLQLRNPAASPRRLRLSLATNLVKDQDSPSFAFHGPIRVNDGVNDTVLDVYVRPTAPRQVLIDDLSLDAGAERPLRLQFFVPGLITIGHQLILEVLA